MGITGYPVGMLRTVAEAAPVDTILSYCRYSLLNTDMRNVLAPLQEKVGLINASPLMMGLLTERGAPAWHSASDALKAAGQRAAKAARVHGLSIAELALQFAMQQDFAASTLIGMSSAEEVACNVATIARPLDLEAVAAVHAAVGEGFVGTWHSGLAENSR